MIKIDDIWEQILALEPDDPSLRFSIATLPELYKIKSLISLYKYREFKANPELKEALGDFKLHYRQEKREQGDWILEIGIVPGVKRSGEREVAVTQITELGDKHV